MTTRFDVVGQLLHPDLPVHQENLDQRFMGRWMGVDRQERVDRWFWRPQLVRGRRVPQVFVKGNYATRLCEAKCQNRVFQYIDGRVATIDVNEVIVAKRQASQDVSRQPFVQCHLPCASRDFDIAPELVGETEVNNIETRLRISEDIFHQPGRRAALAVAYLEQPAARPGQRRKVFLEYGNVHSEPVFRGTIALLAHRRFSRVPDARRALVHDRREGPAARSLAGSSSVVTSVWAAGDACKSSGSFERL